MRISFNYIGRLVVGCMCSVCTQVGVRRFSQLVQPVAPSGTFLPASSTNYTE